MGLIAPEERIKTAFSTSTEVVKQLITLSTAVLTVAAALAKLIADTLSPAARGALIAALVLQALAIFFGLVALGAIAADFTPQNESLTDQSPDPSIYHDKVRWPNVLQQLCFFAGVAVLCVAAGITFFAGHTTAITSAQEQTTSGATTVVIKGSGFGATPGTVVISSSQPSANSEPPAAVQSWSDSEITAIAPASMSTAQRYVYVTLDKAGGPLQAPVRPH
jgi:hypothetical protein